MTKFDYLKISGCLEEIRVFEHFSDVVQVIMRVDGVVIPNFKIPLAIYEELEQGSQVEFYRIRRIKSGISQLSMLFGLRAVGCCQCQVCVIRFRLIS